MKTTSYRSFRSHLLSLYAIFTFTILAGCSVISHHRSTQQVKILLQERRDFNFQDIHFSNNFPSARLNDVTKINDSTFSLYIRPENSPINSSPWYAFKLWADTPQNVYINIHYYEAKHRYTPKLFVKGQWIEIPVTLNKDSSIASFRCIAAKSPLTIAAQEIISSKNVYDWSKKMINAHPYLQIDTIGNSIGEKPIILLRSHSNDDRHSIVILSRQHPPEVTGFMAMQAFVSELLGSDSLAQEFRKHYQLLIMPMLNPDGVDEGNWRHNFNGVDLNRDWEKFKQPETKAVKEFLKKAIKTQHTQVDFGIDFHSTYKDVFYINKDSIHSNHPGLVYHWLRLLEKNVPGFKPSIRPSGNGGNVSKSWMLRDIKAEALTYEVGDETPRDRLTLIGSIAAKMLMESLLSQ